MNDLPDLILLQVFALLSVPEVVSSVANVCVRWRCLAQDDILWYRLKLVVTQSEDLSRFMLLLPSVPQLRSVRLEWRSEMPQIIKALSEHCPRLSSVVLMCCGNFQESCISLLMQYQKTLKVFDIGMSWAVSSKCIDGVRNFGNLTVLNLSHNKVTHDQFKSISESCPEIISLNLDFVRGITEEDLVMFLTPRENKLKYLNVFGELLTNNIFNHIEKCLMLKRLHVSRCMNFSDNCLKSVCKLTKLKSLTLKRADQISPRSLSMFYFESRFVENLKHLYISARRNVTDEDVLLWPTDNGLFDQTLVNQLCTCLLTKNGFKTTR